MDQRNIGLDQGVLITSHNYQSGCDREITGLDMSMLATFQNVKHKITAKLLL